jgi:hypothetical protein
VNHWLIWNEPNQRRRLRPTEPRVYTHRLLNPGRDAIQEENSNALVAGGVTAPRGNPGGVSPLRWIQGMAAANARLDAFAHNPYPPRSCRRSRRCRAPACKPRSGGGAAASDACSRTRQRSYTFLTDRC